jgi:hypothetical protein
MVIHDRKEHAALLAMCEACQALHEGLRDFWCFTIGAVLALATVGGLFVGRLVWENTWIL